MSEMVLLSWGGLSFIVIGFHHCRRGAVNHHENTLRLIDNDNKQISI